jgi:non-specific serine/threonine protein kinase
LDRFGELDYRWAITSTSWALGTVLLRAGRTDEAAALVVRALHRYRAMEDRRGIAQCLESTARLLAAADALRLALAAPRLEPDGRVLDPVRMIMESSLGADRYDGARRAGRAMSLPAVIDLAGDVAAGNDRTETILLTPREREVAALVATGRTNRQIGRALGVAEKTIEVHLHNIMAKLGAQGRAEVAAWAVARGLHDPRTSGVAGTGA